MNGEEKKGEKGEKRERRKSGGVAHESCHSVRVVALIIALLAPVGR